MFLFMKLRHVLAAAAILAAGTSRRTFCRAADET